MKQSPLSNISFAFSVNMVPRIQHLPTGKREFIRSKPLLQSGAAVGALLQEAGSGQSPSDLTHQLRIALKKTDDADLLAHFVKRPGIH